MQLPETCLNICPVVKKSPCNIAHHKLHLQALEACYVVLEPENCSLSLSSSCLSCFYPILHSMNCKLRALFQLTLAKTYHYCFFPCCRFFYIAYIPPVQHILPNCCPVVHILVQNQCPCQFFKVRISALFAVIFPLCMWNVCTYNNKYHNIYKISVLFLGEKVFIVLCVHAVLHFLTFVFAFALLQRTVSTFIQPQTVIGTYWWGKDTSVFKSMHCAFH